MSEPIEYEEDDDNIKRSDFIGMGQGLLTSINVKMIIILFFIGMLIFSDLFINNFLSYFENATEGDNTTTKGTVIQILIYIAGYVIFDLLIKGNIL